MHDDNLTPPHDEYVNHFTSEFYEDLTNEFAPFGSDEGFDVISLAEDHRDEVSEETTVQELLEIVDAPLSDEWSQTLKGQEALDDAVFISSAAFALIRITGRIDSHGHKKALESLKVLIDSFGDESELVQQKIDLESWTNSTA